MKSTSIASRPTASRGSRAASVGRAVRLVPNRGRYSWGFQHGVQSDGRGAIIKPEELKPAGPRTAALRCRTDDAVRFQKSCHWVLTYENDPRAVANLGTDPIPYRHCVYYYSKDQGVDHP